MPRHLTAMFSIDQNCHSLWDVVPKLHALARTGRRVSHFIEDVDVAFSAPGAKVDQPDLRLALERHHRSGGADWGAALFYSEFLGRQPTEIRDWEPLTGMKTSALARQLGRSVDDLYEEFSPGDNWQLIGSSYVGDHDHHRTAGDLSVAEVAEFLREIMRKARADTAERFPAPACQERLRDWFGREQRLLERMIVSHAGGRLVELYGDWLGGYVGGDGVAVGFSSDLFAVGANADRTAVLEAFTRDYDTAAGLYNEALDETHSRLRPLRLEDGELPFFAAMEHRGHRARVAVFLRDGEVRLARPDGKGTRLTAEGRLPTDALQKAGVAGLAGKAVLLTIQVRVGRGGAPLALPFRGSLYMPASRRLADKLAAAGLLPGELRPVVRVRFHLLDRLRTLDVPIRLPEHLAAAFGAEEIAANDLAARWADVTAAAARRLASCEDATARGRWQKRAFPRIFEELDELDALRRRLAAQDPKSAEIRQASKRTKALKVELLEGTLRQIARDTQTAQMDFWDSRGALLPWCMALGGEAFYNDVLGRAEIYDEPAGPP